MTKVNPIPEGYHTITPYLIVPDPKALLDFIQKAFGAKVDSVMNGPDDTIMHAKAQIGSSKLMVAASSDKYPPSLGTYYLYTEDCDAWYHSAMAAGAESLREPTNEFYGDRSCGVMDGNGVQWWIGTHVEDVSEEEMERRHAEVQQG